MVIQRNPFVANPPPIFEIVGDPSPPPPPISRRPCLSIRIVKRFRSKKTCHVLGQFWRFWGINRDFCFLTLNLSFITPKRHILAWLSLHVFWAIARKIYPRVWPVGWSKKRGINKNNFCYISPICPEAPSKWISTKFGIGGTHADV